MQDGFYGNFYRNKPHGEGFVRYCDGSSYTGEFYEGTRHGKGTLQGEDGVRIIGTFTRDKRNGEFEVRASGFFFCQGSLGSDALLWQQRVTLMIRATV